MKDRRYKNSKIETDTRIIDLPDGSTLMTIAAFKDGKFQDMTMQTMRRDVHESA